MRFLISLLAAALCTGLVHAGGEAVVGQWKVTIYEDNQYLNFWLLKFTSDGGKLTAAADTMVPGIANTTVTNAKVNGDLLSFTLKLENGVVFQFEGKLPSAGGKKILGSATREGSSIPAYLEATSAKTGFEANIDILTRTPTDPRVFDKLLSLIAQAKEKKAAPRDVKEWTDGVLASAESYGPTWHANYGSKLMGALRPDFPALAVEYGVKLDKAVAGKSSPGAHLRLLTALADAYQSTGQPAEAAKLDPRLDKAEIAAHAEHAKTSPSFEIVPYAGKTSQPVLVELFTGAHCGPCVAADMGFDGLGKAFKPSEVVLLQYHRHIPRPDALGNADVESRADFYAKSLEGTPEIFFNGKALGSGGGRASQGERKYDEFRAVVEQFLKSDAGGKVAVDASRKGDVVTIRSEATRAAGLKGKVKLRLALVEDWAYYRGQNGVTFHHRVVRAMPGGPQGITVEKDVKNVSTVDIAELRGKLSKYLDEVAKKEEEFPDAQRPMRLRELHAVAFLQIDETGEVLHAATVPVRNE